VCLNGESTSHHLNEFPGQLQDGNLTACSHIVNFSHNAFLQNQQEGVDGVIDEQEMARLREGSLDGALAHWKRDERGLVFLPPSNEYSSFVCLKDFQNKGRTNLPFLVHSQEGEKPRNDLKDQENCLVVNVQERQAENLFIPVNKGMDRLDVFYLNS